jgi:hypothetical protein
MYQAGASKQSPNVMVKGQHKIITHNEYAKYYKIVLRSRDAQYWSNNNLNDGTPNLHRFSEITFPEGIDGNATLIMDSFVAENRNGELDGGYTVHIKELMQPRTWGTDRQGTTDMVFAGKGSVWQNGSVGEMSCGIPITNPTQFRNTPLTVQINSIKLLDPAFAVVGDWCLTFWIVVREQPK